MFSFLRHRRIARKFVESHTTSRLTDIEAMDANAAELIASVPKSFLVGHKLVDQATAKIESVKDLRKKINIYVSILTLILCCAILGVKLEISFLGISLSEVEKLKEFALVAFIAANIFNDFIEYEINYLQLLRKQVSLKLYGEKRTSVLELLHPRLDIPELYPNLDSSNYSSALNPLRLIQFGVYAASYLMILVGFFFLQWIIAYDVWTNSNISYPWNKALVFFFVLSFVGPLISVLLRQQLRSSFWDDKKRKNFRGIVEDEKRMSAAMKDFIENRQK